MRRTNRLVGVGGCGRGMIAAWCGAAMMAMCGWADAGEITDGVLGRDYAAVRSAVGMGHDLDARDAYGRTALHYSALLGDSDSIRLLLKAGADVSLTDNYDETALHSAARRLRLESIGLLLDGGVEIDAVNEDGMSALMLATDHSTERMEADALIAEVATLLLDRGASVNMTDAHGRSALTYAVDRGWMRTAEALEACGGELLGDIREEVEITRMAYRSYTDIEQFLNDMHAMYPTLTERYVLGTSELGRNISAIRISSNAGTPADKPQVRYISTMHGDETVGNEMCLFLIEHLLSGYGSDSRLTAMVDELDIWIVPLMNPDGYVALTRANANGIDLNRAFPDPYTSPNNTTTGRPDEVGVIMEWSWDQNFVLSANMHGGALVVNYPLDNNPSGASVYTATDDDDVMVDLALRYSTNNLPMYNSPSFPQGITNGADWYSIDGGMQDWNYWYNNCIEMTLELSNAKNPSASTIPGFWNDNRESMLSYLEAALIGVRGIVEDGATGTPVDALVSVAGRTLEVKTGAELGNYHRILLPGTYDLIFSSAGYDTLTAPGVVVTSGDATRLDVSMSAPPSLVAPNGGEELGQGVSTLITWNGPSDAAFDVEFTLDADSMQTTMDGFESGSIPGAYTFTGNANWTATTSSSNSGSWSSRAGAITHNQTSTMIRTVEGPAEIEFAYRVSSETNYDFFRFFIDGNEVVTRSGTVNWTTYQTTIGAGTHELRWTYDKDLSVNSGSDTAWVDDIVITSGSTTWTPIGQSGVGESSLAWTPQDLSEDARVRLRAVYPSGLYGSWVESLASFSIVPAPSCPGDIDGDLVVNLADFNILATNFGSGPGATGTSGDLTGDGYIDLADFNILATNFGSDCNARLD